MSFGQGLVFALGGYAAALAFNRLGVTDAVVPGARSAAPRPAWSAPRRSRRCCRATAASSSRMLTLALSMVLYGVLVKTEALGGSDGFNIGRADAARPAAARRRRVGYVLYVAHRSSSPALPRWRPPHLLRLARAGS